MTTSTHYCQKPADIPCSHLAPGSSSGREKYSFCMADNTRCRDTRDVICITTWSNSHHWIPSTHITKTKWLKPNLHIVNRHTYRDMRKADRCGGQVRPVSWVVTWPGDLSWAVLSMSVIRSQPDTYYTQADTFINIYNTTLLNIYNGHLFRMG